MVKIKTPQSVSSLLSLIPQNNSENFLNLLDKYKVTDSKGKYHHWNEFQWRVEKGDDQKLAWLAAKLSRKAVSKQLAILQAKDRSCFSYCIPNSLLAKLHQIDTMTGGGYRLSNSNFLVDSDAEKNKYLVKNLIMEEAITSSQLEGASTTRKVAKRILEKSLKPKNKSQQMIVNNFLLMKEVLARQSEDLSVEMILELHKIATLNAIENQATPGYFRQNDDIFVGDQFNESYYQPPASSSLPERLENLCAFANQCHNREDSDNFIHPLIKAIILHFMIGYIHPFGDGNGRTARALFYWSMLRSGYWLFEYVSISKLIQEKRTAYDKAFIYTETDDFDLTYFIYNQVEVVVKAIAALKTHIDHKKQELSDFMAWIDKSPIAKTLKRGHLEILKEAVKEPGTEFTVPQVANSLGVSQNTARSYLKKLVDEGLLILAATKKVRTVSYIAPAELKDKLQA
ncbi:MAG: Fic family protein [Cyanobacteria bacterium P01_G01_bin.39]